MDDNSFRREYGAVNPRRMSAAAELGCFSSLQDGEALEVFSVGESDAGPATLGAAGRRMKRRDSATQGSHQRHMPIGPLKLPIPRKTKEKIGKLFGKRSPILYLRNLLSSEIRSKYHSNVAACALPVGRNKLT